MKMQDNRVIETQSGSVRGDRRNGVSTWLGIPYASPPTGEQRWQPPRPASVWSGIRDCVQLGDMAEQPETSLFPKIDGVDRSEDCLTLNIWAPDSDARSQGPLPVMVWVHGGGFILGSSAQPLYNGEHLARSGQVVVVTINYRLGVLGFMDFSFLNSTNRGFATNVGLRDVIASLEWVRENIAAFGGNPDDVTVFGESAGAACITTLMSVPRARGLFHRAIAQSPPATSVYGHERAQDITRLYLDKLGIKHDDHGLVERLFRTPSAELIAPTVDLLYDIAIEQPGILAFSPVVDGDLIPEHPIDVFRTGRQHRVPLIIGSNRDEAGLFTMMKSPLMPTTSAAIERMFTLLDQQQPDQPVIERRIIEAYPGWPKKRAAIAISSDAGIRMPVTWIAEAHCELAPTFVYRFDQATPLLRATGLGAVHASELPYVFGKVPLRPKLNKQQVMWFGGTRRARLVSERLQHHWTAFAKTAQPGWETYDRDRRQTLVVNGRDAVIADPDRVRRLAWGEHVISFR